MLSAMTGFLFSLQITLLLSFVVSDMNSFVYNGFLHSELSLRGSSYIRPDGILTITNDSTKLIGHAFYPSALQFKNKNSTFSFSTTFVFSTCSRYPDLGGHGLALVISRSKELKGSLPNQNLGLPNQTGNDNFTRFFAVEFDIVQNAELGDINDNHVGIDIDTLVSNISTPAAYLTGNKSSDKHLINLKSGTAIQAWIEYSGYEKLVTVTLSPLGVPRSDWPLLALPIDLSWILDDFMFVGFSAATGLLSASHEVSGWSFRVGGRAQDLDLPNLPSLAKQDKVVNRKGIVIGITLICITLVLLTISGGFHVAKRMRNGGEVLEDWEVEYGARRFNYEELSAATNGFEERNLIGHGGFGSVYKGVVPTTGLEVAIKRVSHGSKQGLREFVAEITSVGRLRHRNLVQLHGWCRRKDELLLVYDYVTNESLDKLLFNNPKKALTWEHRYKILIGTAQGLLYLHEECDQRVVHRDVKASNILIDGELNAKLGDFGLARIYEHGIQSQTTQIVGTLGYLAPELTRTGKSTTSTDVYGYGALLLEVACGRRPIEPQKCAQELVLVDWVRDLLSTGMIMSAVDPMLDHYDPQEMELVLQLGLLCSHPLPDHRPSMRRVVQFLSGDASLPPLPPNIDSVDPTLEGESSDGFTDSCRMASSKSTSSFPSIEKPSLPTPGFRSTY